MTNYLSKITRKHRGKPKFEAVVQADTAPYGGLVTAYEHMPADYDLDFAVGVQLDVAGLFIGVSRNVGVPIQANWFMFDVAGHGWDQGVWKTPYDTEYFINRLDDEPYRKLLKARIRANHWDGSTTQAIEIIRDYLGPNYDVWMEDRGLVMRDEFFAFDTPGKGWDEGKWYSPYEPQQSDMEVALCFAGPIPSLADIFVIFKDYLPLRGSGTRMTFEIVSRKNAPLFGFDISNDHIRGWDEGAWGADVDHLVTYGQV